MRRLLAGAAVLLLLATGCTDDDSGPAGSAGPSRVDVDTPELRALEAARSGSRPVRRVRAPTAHCRSSPWPAWVAVPTSTWPRCRGR